MAKWWSIRPLRLPVGHWRETPDGKKRYVVKVETIERGEAIPPDMCTPSFLGGNLDKLTALNSTDRRNFAFWKEQNPRLADRWGHIERSPERALNMTLVGPGGMPMAPEDVPTLAEDMENGDPDLSNGEREAE